MRAMTQKVMGDVYEVTEKIFKETSDVQTVAKKFIDSGVFKNLLSSIASMSGEFSRRKIGAETEDKIAMMKKVSEEVSANDEKSSEDS